MSIVNKTAYDMLQSSYFWKRKWEMDDLSFTPSLSKSWLLYYNDVLEASTILLINKLEREQHIITGICVDDIQLHYDNNQYRLYDNDDAFIQIDRYKTIIKLYQKDVTDCEDYTYNLKEIKNYKSDTNYPNYRINL